MVPLWKKAVDIFVIKSNDRFIEIVIREKEMTHWSCLLIYRELDLKKEN